MRAEFKNGILDVNIYAVKVNWKKFGVSHSNFFTAKERAEYINYLNTEYGDEIVSITEFEYVM